MKEVGEEVSTLSPKDIAYHENIDNLYEHLHKRADKILETLAGKEDLAIAKSAQNLKANVDFMNQMNSHSPLVSVIIPAYNAEAFISETLNSVLSQTSIFL